VWQKFSIISGFFDGLSYYRLNVVPGRLPGRGRGGLILCAIPSPCPWDSPQFPSVSSIVVYRSFCAQGDLV
jgi:hypothetical protein